MKKKVATMVLAVMFLLLGTSMRIEAATEPELQPEAIQPIIVYSCEKFIGEEHVQLYYLAKEGESLVSVSSRFALGEEYLQSVNPEYEIETEFLQNSIVSLPESIYWPDVPKLYYWISKGDTLTKISEYFGSSISELLELNPQIKNPDLIYTGKLIRVV